ncbi:hypothetical protein DL96DRAFT_1525030 [Flagelloscypha sp. PMI_526]|nr:hypothetical protein DL96DRAFT_1525030 [Flagelloscypha sp. PMI_526]
MNSSSLYKPLPRYDDENDCTRLLRSKTIKLRRLLQVSLTLNGILLGLVAILFLMNRGSYRDQPLYSPAQDFVTYAPKKFQSSLGNDTSSFQGFTEDVDNAWLDLYSYGMSTLSKEEAGKLVDSTHPISVDGKPQHIIQLAVFHQLHCLNMLRQSLYPGVYPPVPGEWQSDPAHLAHCIDSLRQGVQCASDISPFVWRWHPEESRMKWNLEVSHSCRDFERVKEWAYPRRIRGEWNTSVKVNVPYK